MRDVAADEAAEPLPTVRLTDLLGLPDPAVLLVGAADMALAVVLVVGEILRCDPPCPDQPLRQRDDAGLALAFECEDRPRPAHVLGRCGVIEDRKLQGRLGVGEVGLARQGLGRETGAVAIEEGRRGIDGRVAAGLGPEQFEGRRAVERRELPGDVITAAERFRTPFSTPSSSTASRGELMPLVPPPSIAIVRALWSVFVTVPARVRSASAARRPSRKPATATRGDVNEACISSPSIPGRAAPSGTHSGSASLNSQRAAAAIARWSGKAHRCRRCRWNPQEKGDHIHGREKRPYQMVKDCAG